VQTHELGSPAEVYVTLKDAKGTQLAVSNPAMAPRLDFTAPADGDYYLALEHLLYWSGPAETYRLTLTPYEPGFSLSLAADHFDVAPGSYTPVAIQAARRDYNGPIEVRVIGHAGLGGQVTLSPGAPPNAPAGTLFLHASPDVPPGPYVVRMEGRATIHSQPA